MIHDILSAFLRGSAGGGLASLWNVPEWVSGDILEKPEVGSIM